MASSPMASLLRPSLQPPGPVLVQSLAQPLRDCPVPQEVSLHLTRSLRPLPPHSIWHTYPVLLTTHPIFLISVSPLPAPIPLSPTSPARPACPTSLTLQSSLTCCPQHWPLHSFPFRDHSHQGLCSHPPGLKPPSSSPDHLILGQTKVALAAACTALPSLSPTPTLQRTSNQQAWQSLLPKVTMTPGSL